MQANNRKNPFLLAPASAFAVLVLLLLFRFFQGESGMKSIIFSLIFTIFSFGIPLFLHCFLRAEPLDGIFPIKKPSQNQTVLLLFSSLSLLFISAFIKYAWLQIPFDYQHLTIYGFVMPFPDGWLQTLLAVFPFVLLPSAAEEFFFRGAVFYEYRFGGILMSVLMSALFSALTGLSFSSFPFLFLFGLFFAWIRCLTGNVICSVFSHFIYKIYALFIERYIWLMSVSEESRFLFGFFMIVGFGFSLIGMLHFAAKVLQERANAKEEPPYLPAKAERSYRYFEAVTAPAFPLLVLFYLCTAIFNLFLT